MTETPIRVEQEQEVKKRKVERDNIFLDILYNLVVQMPALVIAWVVSKIDWD